MSAHKGDGIGGASDEITTFARRTVAADMRVMKRKYSA